MFVGSMIHSLYDSLIHCMLHLLIGVFFVF